MNPKLSIVVPCFNEAASLPALVDGFARAGSGRDFELILVDNGSTDGTAEALRHLPPFARRLRLHKNRGYGGGIWAGLSGAMGEYLAWTHADLQCDPADVFAAFDALLASGSPHRTIVKGLRRRRAFREELVTRGMNALATVVLRRPFRDVNGQPKVFHRSLLASLDRPPSDISFDLFVLNRALRLGWSMGTVPVAVHPRAHGDSSWSFSWYSRIRAAALVALSMFRLRRRDAP